MDDQFIRQQSMPKPTNVGDGLVKGTKGLANSIYSGISGIVTQPVSGAKTGGFGGAVKGFGKGLVGVIAKPVAGVTGFASSVTEGIKNNVSGPDTSIIRRPRYTRRGKPVQAFDPFHSTVQHVVRNVNGAKYSTHEVLMVFHSIRGKLVVTSLHLMFFDCEDINKLVWKIKFSNFGGMVLNGNCLEFSTIEDRGQRYSVPFSDEKAAHTVSHMITPFIVSK
ncbi:hypothetical protein RCL1_004862 [Eukaryota sp. TZLM3-RCL]